MPKIDAVFEGGGVKGIGLVGAISAIEKAGYEFECLAGTSAGAITAALLAVGYSSQELHDLLITLDYNEFKDESLIDKLGILGKGLSIVFEYGIYEGKFFTNWIENLLRAKQKCTFGDIKDHTCHDPKYQYKLQVIATDLTDRKLLILPRDLANFGLEPETFSIAAAVRMSMSIPIFFEPVQLQDSSGRTHIIVDGGVLSNYPVWLLDDGTSDPLWPTFGFKLVEPDKRMLKAPQTNPILNTWNYLKAIAGTVLDAHDNYHISISKGDYQRTIGISTVIPISGKDYAVRTTDFDLSREASDLLFYNGVSAAQNFLEKWDFEQWKQQYRSHLK